LKRKKSVIAKVEKMNANGENKRYIKPEDNIAPLPDPTITTNPNENTYVERALVKYTKSSKIKILSLKGYSANLMTVEKYPLESDHKKGIRRLHSHSKNEKKCATFNVSIPRM
jgi:hypothetical protein